MARKKTFQTLSLKTQILSFILFGFGVILASTYWVQTSFIQSARKSALGKIGSNLLASGDVQVDDLIPGLLLIEEKGAIDFILQRIKEKEHLLNIGFQSGKKQKILDDQSCRLVSTRSYLCIDPKRNIVRSIHIAEMDGENLGFLFKEKMGSSAELAEIQRSFLVVFSVLILVLFGLIIWMAFFLEKYVRGPLLRIGETLRPNLDGKMPTVAVPPARVREIQSVFEQVEVLIHKYRDSRAQALVGELAAQVGHDMISPLSAIRMTIEGLEGISDSDRTRLSSAVAKLRQIVSNLREKQKTLANNPGAELSLTSNEEQLFQSIAPCIEEVVDEKRGQYGSRKALKIDFSYDLKKIAVMANIQKVEFQRVISNLIDNSVQAIFSSGNIKIELIATPSAVEVIISDSGRGIDGKIIPMLMQKGKTYGKKNGLGLGLYHARSAIESWGGKISIQSTPGQGTVVTLSLPKAETHFIDLNVASLNR